MVLSEKMIGHIEETFTHKKFVLDSCYKMALILYENGDNDLALKLLRRACAHDNSKLSDEELMSFSLLEDTRNALQDINSQMDEKTKDAVRIHWKNNRHHPEFFSSVNNMEEIDIIEMCCDWHARSVQYGTDLLEFVMVRQKNRFNFDEEVFDRILNYCTLLVKE